MPFTIQSISKPFVLGMALEDRGREAVLARIGVEPSGNPFNAIVVDEASNRPFNPMVNSGAIVATGLIQGPEVDRAPRNGSLDGFAHYVGHDVASRRGGLPLRAADRRPQPRHRLPDARLRDARG